MPPPPPAIGTPPEGGDEQQPVRHPLLTDEARQLIDEGTSLGLDAEAIYQQVRVFDGGHKAADGSFVQTSGVVWANNAPAHDPEDPAQTLPMLPDFTVVDPVIAERVADAVEGELLDVEILLDRASWDQTVSVPHQQALALIEGRVAVRADLDGVRVDVVQTRRAAGQLALEPVLDLVSVLGGEVIEPNPLSGSVRALVPATAIQQLAAAALVTRIESYTEASVDAPGYSMVVEGPVDGREMADYLQSNPFYNRGYYGALSEHIAIIEGGAATIKNDHPSFKYSSWFNRMLLCGGTDPNVCSWDTVTNGEGHATKVAAIIGSDLTMGQDPAWVGASARIQRSGVARRSSMIGMTGSRSRIINILSGFPSVHLLNQSASSPIPDPHCLGADSRSKDWNVLYEAGIALLNSTGNYGHVLSTDCKVGSPGSAIGVLSINAIRVNDPPNADEILHGLSSRGGTSTEGNGRTIVGLATLTGHNYKANSTTPASYSPSTARFGVTSASAPTATGAAAVFREWFDDTYGSLIDDPGILYANLLLQTDGVVSVGSTETFDHTGFDNLYGGGRLRLRAFDGQGLDGPAGWESGSVCVGRYQEHVIPLFSGAPLPAGVDYIKAVTWWYDHDHDDAAGNGHDLYNLSIQRKGASKVWQFVASDISVDNRQRVLEDGAQLQAGGDLYRIRIYGANNVTSNGEGCGTDSNRVYYAVVWEDNARNDDTDMITYVRPEEGIQ